MLLETTAAILRRLAPLGWKELFAKHGLDIEADNLEQELSRELTDINRSIHGFDELSPACRRAIEPGHPEKSLLFFALAHPSVASNAHYDLQGYPTLGELETVENLVYARARRTMTDVKAAANRIHRSHSSVDPVELAVVLFATEFRQATGTAHGSQAEFVYSRTGVARVGTLPPRYMEDARGHWPASGSAGIHVVPCQWKAFIATKVALSRDTIRDDQSVGPMTPVVEDLGQSFWIPIHKLFPGGQCIEGEDLSLVWRAHHENTKIARIHKFFDGVGVKSSFQSTDMSRPPYAFTDGIADLSTDPDLPPGTLVPEVQASLIELARNESGQPVTFEVPPRSVSSANGNIARFWSSLELRSRDGSRRPAPEYVHIRHVLDDNGEVVSLNDDTAMMRLVTSGNYEAVHYKDFTGSGFVDVEIAGLSEQLPVKAGFSIVAAPDFYPFVDQRQVTDWYQELTINEPALAAQIGWGAPPTPLSAVRRPADPNVGPVGDKPFARSMGDDTETTISAVIVRPDTQRVPSGTHKHSPIRRCPILPDSAAGVFAPGWAISTDQTDNVDHLAAYGLGSPYPEDVKLCAALSAFWPAAAPDTTRTYQPRRNSTAPMIDKEIGGVQPWDGVVGITLDAANNRVEFPDRDFSDYVESALSNSFDIRLTAELTLEEYVTRVRRTAQVREYVNANRDLNIGDFVLVSFDAVGATDQVISEIEGSLGTALSGQIYRFVIGTLRRPRRLAGDHRRRRASLGRTIELIAADNLVVHQDNGVWRRQTRIAFV